jgi:hypothetical protein
MRSGCAKGFGDPVSKVFIAIARVSSDGDGAQSKQVNQACIGECDGGSKIDS